MFEVEEVPLIVFGIESLVPSNQHDSADYCTFEGSCFIGLQVKIVDWRT